MAWYRRDIIDGEMADDLNSNSKDRFIIYNLVVKLTNQSVSNIKDGLPRNDL